MASALAGFVDDASRSMKRGRSLMAEVILVVILKCSISFVYMRRLVSGRDVKGRKQTRIAERKVTALRWGQGSKSNGMLVRAGECNEILERVEKAAVWKV